MIAPIIPINEKSRLKALREYSILDSLPEKEYDAITLLASQICGTSIATISLIDEKRQWFKSKINLDVDSTDKESSFCGHAIVDPDTIFTIKDSRLDERFRDNPLVTGYPNVVFYTGVPLVNPEGLALGTLCVIDSKPKELNEAQLAALKALSSQVVSLLELRKSKLMLERLTVDLETRNKEVEKFASVAAHDIKSPLNNILSLTEILSQEYDSVLNDDAKMMLEMLNTSSQTLRDLVDGILEHSRSDYLLKGNKSIFNIDTLVSQCIQLLDHKSEFQFEKELFASEISGNKVALQQILLNLMSNAVKYNSSTCVKIKIVLTEDDQYYRFVVEDNGIGIDPKYQNQVFEVFEVISTEDRFGKRGTGIGLSTVKKLVHGLGGTISLKSALGKGSVFEFTIEKDDFTTKIS